MALPLIKDNEQYSFINRANFAAYACVLGALMFVLAMGCWGLYRDLRLNEATILQSVVSRLQSQATRRAGHIETALEKIEHGTKLVDLRDDPWFKRYWAGVSPLYEQQLYAALVDEKGAIVFHSDSSLEGKQLSGRWYNRVVEEVGADVVESKQNMLAGGEPSYDIQIPLTVRNRSVGAYQEGLKTRWVDDRVAKSRSLILRRWGIVIGAIAIVILLAIVSLIHLTKRSMALSQAVAMAHTQRIVEVGQLAAGLAHEIRNPLHAIRLNLHTLRRAFDGDEELPVDEVEKLTQQSKEEIERVDQLLRELLGYASPEQAREESIDVCEETRSTLEFLASDFRQADIQVDATIPERPAVVAIDKTRFRQIMLNILLNAKEVMPDGGTIRLSLHHLSGCIEIAVEDEGPGIPEHDHDKIFDPFYTTKDGGTGFGLAIAKRFVTDADGTISCKTNGIAGAKFQLTLPKERRYEVSGAMS